MDNPNFKIVIPKKGPNLGTVIIESMKQTDNCLNRLEELAVHVGPVISRTEKQHFDDDNPVFHDVNVIE